MASGVGLLVGPSAALASGHATSRVVAESRPRVGRLQAHLRRIKAPNSKSINRMGQWTWAQGLRPRETDMTCRGHSEEKESNQIGSKENGEDEDGVAYGSGAALVVGEDAGAFDLSAQCVGDWVLFGALLSGVLGMLYLVWIDPDLGVGSSFVNMMETMAGNSELAMLEILFVFAIAHSGLAYLRPYGENLIGARAYRVVFALVSLPLAIAAVVFFINHRYDGQALWNIRGLPMVHETVWTLSFISFYFLYPSTFNILEVAAVDEPKLHLWESGIIRITRHPQAFGQLIWCIAHTAWIGSSFMVATSIGLLLHHAFGCWHGDFRLRRKYGEAFDELESRTSIIPFAAILDGRQKLPENYWREFIRAPYLFLVPFCVGCYLSHPLMQRASLWLGW